MKAELVYIQPEVAALASAAQQGDRGHVAALVARGVDCNAQGDKGINLLQWAILHQSPEGLDALLKAGADAGARDASGSTAMHFAAGAEDPQYLAVLLRNGAPVDTRHGVSGETPLATALLGGRDEQFDMLIEAGANLDATDAAGNTPLHVAGKVNNTRAILALLAKGANPDALNAQGASFMRYLDLTPQFLRTDEANAEVEKISQWLAAHGHSNLG